MRFSLLTLFGLTLAAAGAIAGAGFTSGNILVSTGNAVYECTVEGVCGDPIPVPANPDGEVLRDIVALNDGRLAVYNGTFYPLLSIYDGQSWNHLAVEGWGTINNGSYGGIAETGGSILLTDNAVANNPDEGLIVIDPDSGASTRPVDDRKYIDVAVGLDGLVYALQNTYGDLDVLDPNSYTLLRSVDLGHTSSSRAVTANVAGDIFMVSWDDYLARYTPTGELVDSVNLGADLIDIDISVFGDILVGSRFGAVYITDEAFSEVDQLQIGGTTPFDSAFVAWVPPPGC